MMQEAVLIAGRLTKLARDIGNLAEECGDADQQRYLRSSAELVGREAVKVDHAVASEDDEVIAWALRSVSGMMKGLIDIGSDLPSLAPELWAEAGSTAADAFAAQERSSGT